jgi:hypothetical protein
VRDLVRLAEGLTEAISRIEVAEAKNVEGERRR